VAIRRNDRDPDFPPDLVPVDEALDLVVDAVLLGAKPVRKLTKTVLRLQRRLRRSVDRDAWKVFLELEEVMNERASVQADLLVRWALGTAARARR
jgi:hypothetical protein